MSVLFRNLFYAIVITIASVFINHAMGYNTRRHDIGEIARNGVTIVFWCSIFLTVVQMRARAGDEHSFLIAFRNGVMYSVAYSLLFALFMVLYQHVINPDFYPTYRAYYETRLQAANLKPDLVAARMRQFDMSFDGKFPTYMLLFLFMAMGGFILSAIAAAIYRKPRMVGVSAGHGGPSKR